MNQDRLLNDLKDEEGLVQHAYQDHLGYWTIGYGRLIDKRRDGKISEDEANLLLNNDIKIVRESVASALDDFWADLNDIRQEALVNMAFQLGVNGLMGFKKMLNHLKAGDYTDAATEALRSQWAKQTPERAKRMAERIKTGKHDT